MLSRVLRTIETRREGQGLSRKPTRQASKLWDSCCRTRQQKGAFYLSAPVLAIGLIPGTSLAHELQNEARAAVGATTPFVTLEAEAGKLGAAATIRSITPGMPVPKVATLELEASGHSLVELKNDGDSVSWVNNTGVTANTIVIRASIPDAQPAGA